MFCMNLCLVLNCICANSEGSGDTVQIDRLTRASAVDIFFNNIMFYINVEGRVWNLIVGVHNHFYFLQISICHLLLVLILHPNRVFFCSGEIHCPLTDHVVYILRK